MELREQIAALPDPRILSAAEQAQLAPLDKYRVAFQAGHPTVSASVELPSSTAAEAPLAPAQD